MTNDTFTLTYIRTHWPINCDYEMFQYSSNALCKALGGADAFGEKRLSIGDVAIASGLALALSCLQFVSPKASKEAAYSFAERALLYTDDGRVHNCLRDIRRYLDGDKTVDLKKAAMSVNREVPQMRAQS